eukprot:1151835-Pelagomonas_calceolata.AAC.1
MSACVLHPAMCCASSPLYQPVLTVGLSVSKGLFEPLSLEFPGSFENFPSGAPRRGMTEGARPGFLPHRSSGHSTRVAFMLMWKVRKSWRRWHGPEGAADLFMDCGK